MLIPKIFPISSPDQNTIELIKGLRKLRSNQIDTFLYRRKNLNPLESKKEINLVEETCQQEEIFLVFNSFHINQLPENYSGIHLTSEDLKKHNERPISKDKVLGVSCHNKREILMAESIEADYIFLSPVKETSSHPGVNPIGWKKFRSLVLETNIPVLALGGLQKEDVSIAQKNGAYGIAGIRKFWSSNVS